MTIKHNVPVFKVGEPHPELLALIEKMTKPVEKDNTAHLENLLEEQRAIIKHKQVMDIINAPSEQQLAIDATTAILKAKYAK
ncbi:hypothetical protein [Pseudomonas sp. GV047]|uniref:hypothetical protein n=1 Tax=Pseudomonas sp. GV047 TaxID=2135751 RepID=UPI000D382B0F|nr:hypothetical protein [Pseudomonas sp. GV047]PUB40055.1 hypothetical protein C8K58_11441 [Pseudomonas sp. GV047]